MLNRRAAWGAALAKNPACEGLAGGGGAPTGPHEGPDSAAAA